MTYRPTSSDPSPVPADSPALASRRAWPIAGLVASAACLPLLAACSPLTVSFTFGADERRVSETEVARDEHRVSGKVALIDVRGTIAEDPTGWLSDGPGIVDSVVAQLNRAEKDSGVRSIILRINSPGGTVTASDVLYREVRGFAARTKKPVVISMGEIAASGGYYLALAGDHLVAEPTTLTGSIGVIIPTINVHEGLGRLGIRAKNIKSGANKDLIDPLGKPSDEHDAIVQAIVNEFYAKFRSLVVERRTPAGLVVSRLDELTDGRVVTGATAKDAGLIDDLGGVSEAFAAAKRLAGLDGARLVKYHPVEKPARTPYSTATATAGQGGEPSRNEFNLLRLDTSPTGLTSGAGVYYLWMGW